MKITLKTSVAAVILLVAVYAGGVVLLGGNSQPTATAKQPQVELPEHQEQFIFDLRSQVQRYEEDATVSAKVNKSGGDPKIEAVAVRYRSDATSEDELMSKFRAVGSMYVDTLNQSSVEGSPTLVLRDTNVQAALADPVIREYRDGDLKRSAVLKSIEVTQVVPRNTTSTTDDSR